MENLLKMLRVCSFEKNIVLLLSQAMKSGLKENEDKFICSNPIKYKSSHKAMIKKKQTTSFINFIVMQQ